VIERPSSFDISPSPTTVEHWSVCLLVEDASKSTTTEAITQMPDVFISHASEDKAAVAEPLTEALIARGYSVWYDQFMLHLGDSLLAKIDEGLMSSRYAVVILSPSFIAKQWTKRELEGLVARETQEGAKRILPIWHNVTADEVAHFSLTLSSRLAVSTAFGLPQVIEAVVEALGPPTAFPGESKAVSPVAQISGNAARSLADAVERAREYLRPQPLIFADTVAEAVRRSFSEASVKPTLLHVGPYLASPDPAFRVVGYLAAQVAAHGSDIRPWTLELTIGFGREQQEATSQSETRPLWQLLVAVGNLLDQNPPHPDRDYLRNAMVDTDAFLKQHQHIDPGGECKRRLGELLARSD
jgi:TIR domain